MSAPEVTEAAVKAAIAKHRELLADRPDPMVLSDESLFRRVLEAALPHLTALQNEPPGVWQETPRLLSRWEFQGVAYVLVTMSTGDDDSITLKYMPEAAYLKWSARQKKATAKGGQ